MLRVALFAPHAQTQTVDFLMEAVKSGSYIEKIAIDSIDPTCDASLRKNFLSDKTYISQLIFSLHRLM
jgi:hypothetical protein